MGIEYEAAKSMSRMPEDLEIYDRTFEAVYNHRLDIEKTRQGSIVISLDEIPADNKEASLEFLRGKLDDYTGRVQRRKARLKEQIDMGDVDTETLVHAVSANYKRVALQTLLERGTVNTWALSNTFEIMDGFFINGLFENALRVIHAYVKDGGSE